MKALSFANTVLGLALISRLEKLPLAKVAAILLNDQKKQQLVHLALSRKALVLEYFTHR